MLESVKEEAKKIVELKNNQKIKITNKFNFYVFFIFITIFTLIMNIVSPEDVTNKPIFGLIYISLMYTILLTIPIHLLNMFISNKISKNNIIEETGLKVLSSDYLITNKRREKIKKDFESLSEDAKEFIILNRFESKMEYHKVLNDFYHFKVMYFSIDEFIKYIKNDIEEDFKSKDLDFYKNDLIKEKLQKILESISEFEFNKYQKEIMNIIEIIQSKSIQLKLFKKMKILREKYDEKIISSEIENIKNELNKKQIKNINVLKSI